VVMVVDTSLFSTVRVRNFFYPFSLRWRLCGSFLGPIYPDGSSFPWISSGRIEMTLSVSSKCHFSFFSKRPSAFSCKTGLSFSASASNSNFTEQPERLGSALVPLIQGPGWTCLPPFFKWSPPFRVLFFVRLLIVLPSLRLASVFPFSNVCPKSTASSSSPLPH